MKTNVSATLTGKVALVTGASKGIGASIARHLAAEGANVIVNYASDKAGAERVVAQIEELGGRAIAVKANVANHDEIKQLVAEGVKAFGKIDVLVNNAGVFEFLPIGQITEEHFHRQFNINVLGLLLTTQESVKHFPESGGSVINVSSLVSRVAPPASAVYSGTKGAVDVITKVLSTELGPRGIRVNSLGPGMVETEGYHSAGIPGSDLYDKVVRETPLGRIGQPEDIAKVAVFLASDASAWVSGEALVASGGNR